VRETAEEIVARVVHFRRLIAAVRGSGTRAIGAGQAVTPPQEAGPMRQLRR